MTLDVEQPEAKPAQQPVQQTLPLEDKDPFAPRMEEVVEEVPAINFFATTPVVQETPVEEAPVENFTLQFELSTEITEEVVVPELPKEEVHIAKTIVQDQMLQFTVNEQPQQPATTTMFSKPMNIYAEPEMPATCACSGNKSGNTGCRRKPVVQEEEMLMQLVEKEEKPAPAPVITPASFIDDSVLDDAEEQKRRAARTYSENCVIFLLT